MSAMPAVPYEAFSITLVPNRSEVAVVPAGEIDLSCVGELEREIQALWDVGFKRVVVDLRRVTFMDSAGLQLLLDLRRAGQGAGRTLKLVPGPPEVQRIFEITATHGLFAWRDC